MHKEYNSKEIIKENHEHLLLRKDLNFETFVIGTNNECAYKAAFEVSKNPGNKYNLFIIYGESGVGKTHLLQSIGNYIYKNTDGKCKICYVTAEKFTNEFVEATSLKKINEFRNKYRDLDVLLLDDIHFLQNKDAAQEELFYTYNALYEKHAQIVVACDCSINKLNNFNLRLLSRLKAGLDIEVKLPEYETRLNILRKKLELQGREQDEEVIEYLAQEDGISVRQLIANLSKVLSYAELLNVKSDLKIAKKVLEDV